MLCGVASSTLSKMRLQHEKKELLYLTPEKKRVTIVLGGYACGLAMAGSLPAAIKPDSQDCEGPVMRSLSDPPGFEDCSIGISNLKY